jgi:hypothetical protein
MRFKNFKFLGGLICAIVAILGFTKLVYSQEQSLSITVDPHPFDFQSSIASSATDTVKQFTEITYTITYGSYLYYNTPITVQADWSLGTLEGGSIADTDVVDYVIGSASNAYNSTPPVVDLVNKKITWTINSFPQRTTDQTVTFKLKTNDNYTGTKKVTFDVYSRTINYSLIVSNQVEDSYLFDPTSVTPTPTFTPTPTPTTAPTPTPTAGPAPTSSVTSAPTPISTLTPTPTMTISPLTFESVNIGALSSGQAIINLLLNEKAKVKISYGTSINTLTSTVLQNEYLKNHQIKISSLTPDKTYYVVILATTASNKTAKSDIFSFKTPPVSIPPLPEAGTLVITSNDLILTSPSVQNKNNTSSQKDKNGQSIIQKIIPLIVLPREKIYNLKFEIKDYLRVKKIKVIVRRMNVLGINTFSEPEDAASQEIELTNLSLGVFEGKLKAPNTAGDYEIVAVVYDTDGNIAENKIAEMKVAKKLTVLNENNKKQAVEGARVLVKIYNLNTKKYQVLSSFAYSIENPSYTDSNGEDDIVLPIGKYKITTTAIGYASKETDFELGNAVGQDYPTIYLKPEFSAISFVNYLKTSFADFMNITKYYLLAIGSSNRFFEFNAILTLFVMILMILFGLSFHTRIPLHQLHLYLINLFRQKFSKNFIKSILMGKVLDFENSLPESQVTVYLIDGITNNILAHTITNKLGEFSFKKPKVKNYKILIMKDGFDDFLTEEFDTEKLEKQNLFTFNIREKARNKSIRGFFKEGIELLFALIIPGLIIASLIVELTLGYSFGWVKLAPFLVVSVANAFLWAKFYKPVFKNL